MPKSTKILITLTLIAALACIITFIGLQFSGNSWTNEYNDAEDVTLDQEYQTYSIGSDNVGWLYPMMQYTDQGNNRYLYNDYIVQMYNLDIYKPQLDVGTVDIYEDDKIKDLPKYINDTSKMVLNNLYNKNYLIEKFLIADTERVIICSGENKSGTIGDELKQETNSAYEPTYMLTDKNILIITLMPREEAVELLVTYSYEKLNL